MNEAERVRLAERDARLQMTSAAVESATRRCCAAPCRESCPASSSITMNGCRCSVVPTSDTRHTFSPRSCADARASRMKRSTTRGFCITSWCRNFSATGVPELQVRRRDDDAHATGAELALDAVLASDDGAGLVHP